MPVEEQKRVRVSQSDFPNLTLKETSRIAQAIWDNFAGRGAAPHTVAMALDLSPTSGGWRNLCGASIAYGLTEGGYNANEILLTDLGRKMVAPTAEGDDARAMQQAVLIPTVMGDFFKRYDRSKFPKDNIAENVLVDMGLPKERASGLVKILKENGQSVGFISETKTGPFVSLDSPVIRDLGKSLEDDMRDDAGDYSASAATPGAVSEPQITKSSVVFETPNNRVFITHGKNHKILEQIKEVVELGGFIPVISTRTETTAKPIPEKVLDDMRSSGAAIIHVGLEETLTDEEGNSHQQLNPNVLIEIGAAMALYKGRYILVVEEGVKLPSNLQGLYESRYTGDSIEFQAGMRILKALRGLKAD